MKRQNMDNTEAKGRKRPVTGRKRACLITLGGLLAIIIALSAIVYPLFFHNSPSEALIRVPLNASRTQVCDSVEKYLGAHYAGHVGMAMRMLGSSKKDYHGAYRITKGMSPVRAANMICKNRQSGVDVVIKGHRTKEDLARRISRYLDITPEAMTAVLCDTAFLATLDTDPDKVMGLFLNDTYQFYWTATPQDVVKKIAEAYARFWNNERLQKAEALGLSPIELSIIASIADEETALADEKGRIGRLYINRLACGMRLQADPTVRYALNDFTIKRVTSEDTKVESPYNTYRIAGLPPGPIRTPDPATIDAILNSEPSDDIYMCADPSGSGRHLFTNSYTEHLANAKSYHSRLDALNIRR